jgi:hypothetical protein
MNIILLALIAAGLLGGGYVAAAHVQEIQQAFHNIKGNAQINDTNFKTEPQSQEPISLSPSPSSQVAEIGALSIVDARMYYSAPSYVTVKNTGTDQVVLQHVSYGQNSSPTGDLLLQPEEQQQVTLTQITGAIGSSYLLQVQGTSVSTGKVVTAQISAIFREPLSKLEATYSQINIINGGGNPTLQLTLRNSGMDTIFISGIICGKPIPKSLWASDGQSVPLQPNEERTLNIQFDSLDYIGAKHQNPDGTVTYLLPQAGWTKDVAVTGANSLGHTLSIVVVAPVAVSTVQKDSDVPTGIRISITDAIVQIDNSGRYTVSFIVSNNSTSDIILNSLKVKGVKMPWSDAFTMQAGSTFKVKSATSGGLSDSDIGSSVDVIVSGQVLDGDSQDVAEGTPVYATASAPILST